MNEKKVFDPTLGMKALTWKQPFAELMLHGKIETRTWRTHYRGWVLICAAAQSYSDKKVIEIIGGQDKFKAMLDKVGLFIGFENEGHAIAIGRLVNCRPMEPDDEDKCFVAFNPKLWCHIYSDVIAIEPVPWKGGQGWRIVPDQVKQHIKLK